MTISGSVFELNNFPDRTDSWSLYDNGNLLTGGDLTAVTGIVQLSAGSGGATVLQDISVLPGDVLTLFIASTSTFGSFVDTNLTVDLTTATSAPEPSSLIMLGGFAAVICIGSVMRRRRRWADRLALHA